MGRTIVKFIRLLVVQFHKHKILHSDYGCSHARVEWRTRLLIIIALIRLVLLAFILRQQYCCSSSRISVQQNRRVSTPWTHFMTSRNISKRCRS
jgi:hypothetical protein